MLIIKHANPCDFFASETEYDESLHYASRSRQKHWRLNSLLGLSSLPRKSAAGPVWFLKKWEKKFLKHFFPQALSSRRLLKIVSGFHSVWPITHSELLPSVAERAGRAGTPDPNPVTVNGDPFGNPEQMFASTAHQQVTMGRGCHQVLISFCRCHLSIPDLLLTVTLLCIFCCHSWTRSPAALRAFGSIHHQNSLQKWEKRCSSSGPR